MHYSCRYLENLLNMSLQRVSFFLPEVHFNVDYSKCSASGKFSLEAVDKKGKRRNVSDICSLGKKKKRKQKGTLEPIKDASQPTILEVLQRAGASVTVGATEKDSSGFTSLDRASKPCDNATFSKTLFETISDGKVLDNQRFKFRVLHVKCLFMLSFIKVISSVFSHFFLPFRILTFFCFCFLFLFCCFVFALCIFSFDGVIVLYRPRILIMGLIFIVKDHSKILERSSCQLSWP